MPQPIRGREGFPFRRPRKPLPTPFFESAIFCELIPFHITSDTKAPV